MENFIIDYGLLALALCLFIDDLGIPFPTSTVIFSSAVLARTTPEIPLFWLYLITISIPPVGNTILFWWGSHGARKWLNTHGHKLFLTNSRLRKGEQFFEKYGEKTIFFGAMITSLRPVLSIIAGSVRMHPAKFVVFHFFGIIIWASTIIGTGYFFGQEIWEVVKNNWQFVIVIILIIITMRLQLKILKLFKFIK